jgi:hypothetical protein
MDKARIWFMPTGWRPADMMEKYPLKKIEDVYSFEKYDPPSSTGLRTWAMIQLVFLLLFISYLFGNLAQIGSPGIFLYGLFIFLYIYALTSLMDGDKNAFVWEGIKCITAIFLIYSTGGWFGAEKYHASIPYLVGAYLVVSIYLSTNFSISLKVSVPSESNRS